jgi:VanZ family protein
MNPTVHTGQELRLTKLWFFLAYMLLLVTGVISLMPAPDIGGSDKIAHFIVFLSLSAWFSLIVEHRKSLWLVLIGLIAYGLLLELLQGLTTYRTGDFRDALANSLGVVSGIVFYFSPLRRLLRQVDVWLQVRL